MSILFDISFTDSIGVRGFPNGIFHPWVRWITGLALAKNSSAVVVVAVVALQKCGKCKKKILDESGLEQRSRRDSTAIFHIILVRFFLAIAEN